MRVAGLAAPIPGKPGEGEDEEEECPGAFEGHDENPGGTASPAQAASLPHSATERAVDFGETVMRHAPELVLRRAGARESSGRRRSTRRSGWPRPVWRDTATS